MKSNINTEKSKPYCNSNTNMDCKNTKHSGLSKTMKIYKNHHKTDQMVSPINQRNAILICVFMNEDYLRLLYLLLESIYIYGNINDDTDIIIYTNTDFANKIKQTNLFSNKIVFQINDNYNTLDQACKSRLDIFEFTNIVNYKKILYLDTDILVTNDLNDMFDLAEKDVLYAKKEGSIDNEYDFYGRTFFENDCDYKMKYSNDMSAFSSGVLLFKTTEPIIQLFKSIKDHIAQYYHPFYDQPHVVYISKSQNMIDKDDTLDKYIYIQKEGENNEFIHNNSIIHFSRGVGVFKNKIDVMNDFLMKKNIQTSYNILQYTKHFIDVTLMPIIKECGENLEGNIFMYHNQTTYNDEWISKQHNIAFLLMNKNMKNVLEIGFNAGFSSLLMLFANKQIKLTCVDICYHSYTVPCFEAIQKVFGERIQLIRGDSTKVMSNLTNKYDLIHIDGGHDNFVTTNDIINSYRLSKKGTVLIMDDYDFEFIHNLWDKFIISYDLKPLETKLINCREQDIKMKKDEDII